MPNILFLKNKENFYIAKMRIFTHVFITLFSIIGLAVCSSPSNPKPKRFLYDPEKKMPSRLTCSLSSYLAHSSPSFAGYEKIRESLILRNAVACDDPDAVLAIIQSTAKRVDTDNDARNQSKVNHLTRKAFVRSCNDSSPKVFSKLFRDVTLKELSECFKVNPPWPDYHKTNRDECK